MTTKKKLSPDGLEAELRTVGACASKTCERLLRAHIEALEARRDALACYRRS